jgi:hypothetical protein
MFVLAVIERNPTGRVLGACPPDHGWVAGPCATRGPQDAGGAVSIGPRRQVPTAVQHDPRRDRHQSRAHRCQDASHERDHGTLDPKLPPRTARPDAALEPSPPAARTARVRTSPQRASARSGHLERQAPAPMPIPSRIGTASPDSTYADATALAVSSTSTNTLLHLPGRNSRHAQRRSAGPKKQRPAAAARVPKDQAWFTEA